MDKAIRKNARKIIRRVEDDHVDSSSLRSQSAWAAINSDLEIRLSVVNRPKAVRSGCSNQRLARKLEPQAACF